MKGPFGLVVAAGLALLIVGILFSLAPTVGGSIDNGNPIIDDMITVALLNNTNVSTGHRNIGGVQVFNLSTMTAASELTGGGDEYLYTSSVGTITLLNSVTGHNNYNGTYYAKLDYSRWSADVNTDFTEGGTWFSDNATWVTLCFLGIVAGIIIAMFMRW